MSDRYDRVKLIDGHLPTEHDPMPWAVYGNCVGVDSDLFFPERGAPSHEAKAVCRGCEVRDECREFAIEHDERFGIWGGTSYRDRKRIVALRRRGVTA